MSQILRNLWFDWLWRRILRHPTSAACIIIFSILFFSIRVCACARDDQNLSNSMRILHMQKMYFLVFMLFITLSSVFDLRCDIDIISNYPLLFNFTKNSVNSCRVDYLHRHRLKKNCWKKDQMNWLIWKTYLLKSDNYQDVFRESHDMYIQ